MSEKIDRLVRVLAELLPQDSPDLVSLYQGEWDREAVTQLLEIFDDLPAGRWSTMLRAVVPTQSMRDCLGWQCGSEWAWRFKLRAMTLLFILTGSPWEQDR